MKSMQWVVYNWSLVLLIGSGVFAYLRFSQLRQPRIPPQAGVIAASHRDGSRTGITAMAWNDPLAGLHADDIYDRSIS